MVRAPSHCPHYIRAGKASCRGCESGEPLPSLVDRKGYVFPLERLRMPHGCHLRVLNSLPTWLPDKHGRALRDLAQDGRLNWRLRFMHEPLEQCRALVRRAKTRLLEPSSEETDQEEFLGAITTAHFSRGAE